MGFVYPTNGDNHGPWKQCQHSDASSQLQSTSIEADHYPANSGPNVESNIETPPENIRERYPVNTTLTTSYLSRGARIRTGDLLLPKLLLGPPIFGKMA